MNPREYLSVMNRSNGFNTSNINMLVSGSDELVLSWCLEDLVARCRSDGKTLVIIDDANFIGAINTALLARYGYSVRNLLSGDVCIYDPFSFGSLSGMTGLRQLVEAMGLDEEHKLKVFVYLNLLSYLDKLANASSSGLTISKLLFDYGSGSMVQAKIRKLRSDDIVDYEHEAYLMARYSEAAPVAPVFESILFTLSPFINRENTPLTEDRSAVLVLPLHQLDGDKSMKIALLSLLRFGLSALGPAGLHILLTDRGYGDRTALSGFIEKVAPAAMTLLSKDAFTFGEQALEAVFNRFDLRVYSRHTSGSSCAAIESALGEALVVKRSYASHHDRRWAANKPLDVLFGKNKSESYTQLAPVYEARYRREMIAGLPAGSAIIEYLGNSSVVSCR